MQTDGHSKYKTEKVLELVALDTSKLLVVSTKIKSKAEIDFVRYS